MWSGRGAALSVSMSMCEHKVAKGRPRLLLQALFGIRVLVGIGWDIQFLQNLTHNPLSRGRVLRIEKNTLKFRKE
jgi:hypothetical protein